MTPKQPIDVAVNIELPPEQVWDYVKDIESHTDWMRDASAIRITSDSAAGKGTTFECDTKIGPFRLVDKMEITDWVFHINLVKCARDLLKNRVMFLHLTI